MSTLPTSRRVITRHRHPRTSAAVALLGVLTAVAAAVALVALAATPITSVPMTAATRLTTGLTTSPAPAIANADASSVAYAPPHHLQLVASHLITGRVTPNNGGSPAYVKAVFDPLAR